MPNFYKILFIIILVVLMSGYFAKTSANHRNKSQKVEYFAVLKSFSSSGDMRFYWYDPVRKQILNPDDEFAWFFAMPDGVPSNDKAVNDWVKLIENNQTSIFKITGLRETDDCEYYGPEHCVQAVVVEKIEKL